MPGQKHRQRQERSSEETEVSGQPGGAESQIDEEALEETLTDIDAALAEIETDAEEQKQTAIREWAQLGLDQEEAVAAFNAKYAHLGLVAWVGCACCVCGSALYDGGEVIRRADF